MMNLDEAIQHCEEVADTPCFTDEEARCYSEHRQLAEWLKELKAYREQSSDAISRKAAIDLADELKDDLPDDDRLSDMVMSHNEGILDYQTKLSLLPSVTQQPCGDAISRQAVLNAMYELCSTGETLKENPWRDNPHIDAVVEAIEELPSVTPQQKTKQRTGRWIYHNGYIPYKHECSECGKRFGTDFNYCPHCGAKMEVE